MFVWLTFATTLEAIVAGCEAAWQFFGGVFRVLILDNMKPIVAQADAVNPQFRVGWLEYAQARGLPPTRTRVAAPQDKDDVETIFGDSITALNEHPDGVCVSFAQAKTRDFDLVIGADGLHSNVRRLTFGPESDVEHFLGCLVAACVVEGYRPRDELVYVTHSQPGRSVERFTLRDDRTMFLFVFRSEQAADPCGELAARKAA